MVGVVENVCSAFRNVEDVQGFSSRTFETHRVAATPMSAVRKIDTLGVDVLEDSGSETDIASIADDTYHTVQKVG